jgi:hypothetical protein
LLVEISIGHPTTTGLLVAIDAIYGATQLGVVSSYAVEVFLHDVNKAKRRNKARILVFILLILESKCNGLKSNKNEFEKLLFVL